MKTFNLYLLLILSIAIVIYGCKKDEEPDPVYEEVVAVANRAGASVSFVNAVDNTVISTLEIPGSEPMYAVYVPAKDKLYVGDRANNKVLVIDPATKTVESSITVGEGVFHMWADGQGNQLWVNNDIDYTTSVINLSDNSVGALVNIPLKPHDVFVNDAGTMAYVSAFSGDPNVVDSVYAFSTSTYQLMAEAGVGKDPHLFHVNSRDKLYVPCQSGTVFSLNSTDLSESNSVAIDGSHGIFGAPDGNYVYVADIVDKQLYTIDPSTDATVGSPLTTTDDKPHNLAVNEGNDKLFVTHSGATANTLSIYGLESGGITSQTILELDTNPFGLAYYKRLVSE